MHCVHGTSFTSHDDVSDKSLIWWQFSRKASSIREGSQLRRSSPGGKKIQILGWTRKQQHPLKMYYHMLEWMMSTSCSQKSAFMVPLLQYSIAVDRLRIAMVLILKKLPTKTTLVSGFWGEECFWMLATCLCPRSCSRAWRGRQCCWWSSWGSLVQDPLWKRLQLSRQCSSARSWKPRSHQTTQTWWGVALLKSWSGTNLS